jgi:hypothetical protein
MSFAAISAALTSATFASAAASAAVSAAISIGISAVTAALTPDPPDINLQGPRLGDLKVQSSTYGNAIPIVYGSMRLAGNMIWSTPIIETAHVTSQESGGKGFGGSQTVNNTNYTYSQSFAIALCEGEIIGVRKIWANGEIIYNVAEDADIHTLAASNANVPGIRFYKGSETQFPDALIQADVGVDNCPAYRGLAYVVFEDLQLADYGNRTPNLEFEVVGIGVAGPSPWTMMTGSAQFDARTDHSAFVLAGAIYVAGGYDGTSNRNDVWSSVDGENWVLKTVSAGFSPRSDHASVVLNGRAYVIGGGAILSDFPDVWSTTDGINWTQETADAGFSGRARHAAVVMNGLIYMIGGTDGDYKNDVWSTADGKNWTQVTAAAGFSARQKLAAAVLNGLIYVIGGRSEDGAERDVWSSPDGANWTLVTADAGFEIQEHKAVALNGRLYVIAGSDSTAGTITGNDDVWSSADGANWTQETSAADFGYRYGHASVVHRGMIYMIGGAAAYLSDYENDVWVWPGASIISKTAPTLGAIVSELCERAGLLVSDAAIPADAAWTQKTAAALFSSRYLHVSAVIGSTMYVIGGYTGSAKNDVWSSAGGETWTQVTAVADFSARYAHAAVVIDEVIFVIGGFSAGYNNDVWSSSDGENWIQVTAAADFSARGNHASVVLLGSIYVIGGIGAGGATHDVWSSPDGSTWTQVTATADFSARGAHAAVVLDGVMYVIGGDDGSKKNDVWSSSDGENWTQVTAAADFSARSHHVAVVINGLIYVIGGIGAGFEKKNDVWSSPDGATWTQVTADAEFSARASHSAVVNEGLIYVIGGLAGAAKNDVWSWNPGVPETDSDIDVTDLSDSVDGYMITKQGAARAAIEPLMQAFYFDAIESDAKIKFVKRGQSHVVSIPEDDLAAHAYGSAVPDQLIINRAQEMELPVEISIQYLDKDAAYGVGAQYARRLTTSSRNKTAMQLQMSLSASKAKQIVDVLLYDAWTARASFSFALSNKYAYLEPTDVVQVTKAGRLYTARLTDKDEANGIHSYTAVLEDAQIYSQNAVAASLPAPIETVAMIGPTLLHLLDIPLLRDQDDGIGFYAAACGYMTGWRGAQLFKSIDDGASYEQYESAFLHASTIGSANDALGDFAGGNIFDEANTATVRLINGTLAGITELAVLNGGNVALLGNEILQFKNATLTGINTYTLSGLLRGRLGTEWAMSEHAAGERFVVLSAGTTYIEQAVSSELGLARKYRAATFGSYLADAMETEFTHNSVAQKCYAPAQLGGGRDADGNLTLKWVRRSRRGGSWNNYTDVPLGEASESYVIQIYTDSDYETLKRTLTSSTATVQYTSAQQVEDFGSNQDTVYWRVAQVSATVGNGYFARGII